MPAEFNNLFDVVDTITRSVLAGVNTALPGVVEAYDFSKSKADVKPCIKKRFNDGTTLDYPVLTDIPVIWPRTSEGGIFFPLKKGDFVLLVFSQRSIDIWLSKGGSSTDPRDLRKFDLSDGIAIPGLFPFSTQSQAANNTDMLIKFKSGTVEIKASGQVNINNGNLTVDL